MTEQQPLTLTVEEAGRLLGVSRGLAYAAARDGSLPTVRLGRRLLVPRHALEQLLTGPTNSEGPAGNGTLAKTSDQGARHEAYPRL
jgi:excisionase family DNA binding protein